MKKKILIILFLIICTVAYGQAMVSEESLKAAFIFRFINFVEWNDNQPDYIICIPDDEMLRDAVSQAFKGKMVNNRHIAVVKEKEACHILISDSVPLAPSMLTIGPLAKGALLEFRLVNNKLKFAINVERVKKSQLKISSQLLKLAILEKNI